MGGCFSDVRGEKQAVGGTQQSLINNGGDCNEAVDFFFKKSQGAVPLFTPLELSFSASNLLDRDFTSKSDPMVVVYSKKGDGMLEELGRTEVILNNLNPVWIEKVRVSYQFEAVQQLVFHVYDVDTKYYNINVMTLKLKDQEFLGEGTCVLSEIVTKHGRSLTLNLHDNHGRLGGLRNLGTLTVLAEETIASKSVIEMKFRCSRLENKDLFSKSDPFLRISRIVESGVCVPICKTEVVDNNLNPTWKQVCLSMQQFGSKDRPLVIECFDFNRNGKHILIGKLQKSVTDLEKLYQKKSGINFVIPPSSHRGREKLSKGQLFVDHFCEKEQSSFLDYISSGFELNFMVAVDFTASNKDPQISDSLHYIDPRGRLNSYQNAIMQVGEVIQFYDSDKRFPVWGFGGMIRGAVSHCFTMDGTATGEVEGVEGIMSAYSTALRKVQLCGPTLFGAVVNKAAEIANHSHLQHNNNKYFVLLIITDGILTDLQETIDALVRASDLPLSILIVGVGNADFQQMEILDADNGQPLRGSTGRLATRDIVQFVPMREVDSGRISVVQSLLEELPGQFLTYMRSKGIKPLSPSNSKPHAKLLI